MKKLLVLLVAVCLAGCNRSSTNTNPIVGTWFVDDVAAPFRFHMYVFNADGTMQQANPDAGDTKTSDSDGKGIWLVDGDTVKGKWTEILADRTTHKFAGTMELVFELKVDQDRFVGTSAPRFFDVSGKQTEVDKPTPLTGKRVTLP